MRGTEERGLRHRDTIYPYRIHTLYFTNERSGRRCLLYGGLNLEKKNRITTQKIE